MPERRQQEVRVLIWFILMLTVLVVLAWPTTLTGYVDAFLSAAVFQFIC